MIDPPLSASIYRNRKALCQVGEGWYGDRLFPALPASFNRRRTIDREGQKSPAEERPRRARKGAR
jgi:hypothetical protein